MTFLILQQRNYCQTKDYFTPEYLQNSQIHTCKLQLEFCNYHKLRCVILGIQTPNDQKANLGLSWAKLSYCWICWWWVEDVDQVEASTVQLSILFLGLIKYK